MKIRFYFAVALLITYLPVHSAPTESLTWAGCGISKKAFMTEMVVAYEEYSGVHIELQGGGATKGIRKTVAGETDMGGSCRFKLNDSKEFKAQMNPVAWDALVVIVNQENPIDDISIDQLKLLYDGKITNWKQLGGEDHALKLFVRKGKISGVGRMARELIFADVNKEFPDKHVFKSSGPLEKGVVKDPYAIAMTGISSAKKRDVKILKLGGKEPTPENIRTGKYILYRTLYIVSTIGSPKEKAVNRFLEFVYSAKGRKIIRDNEVVPYMEGIGLRKNQRQQWKQLHEREKKV